MTIDGTIGWLQDLLPILGVLALALAAKGMAGRLGSEPDEVENDASGHAWFGRSWSARSWSARSWS